MNPSMPAAADNKGAPAQDGPNVSATDLYPAGAKYLVRDNPLRHLPNSAELTDRHTPTAGRVYTAHRAGLDSDGDLVLKGCGYLSFYVRPRDVVRQYEAEDGES